MTRPKNPGGGKTPWWVIDVHSRGFSGFIPMQSAKKPTDNPYSSYSAGPFTTIELAKAWISKHQTYSKPLPNPLNWVKDWITSTGGMVASGIEAGLDAFATDLWTAISGVVEIVAGAAIALIVLTTYFKNDMAFLASFVR